MVRCFGVYGHRHHRRVGVDAPVDLFKRPEQVPTTVQSTLLAPGCRSNGDIQHVRVVGCGF